MGVKLGRKIAWRNGRQAAKKNCKTYECKGISANLNEYWYTYLWKPASPAGSHDDDDDPTRQEAYPWGLYPPGWSFPGLGARQRS